MRTDTNICSSKACTDRRDIALQNGEDFTCEHFNLIKSETQHMPLLSLSVSDIKRQLNDNLLGEETSRVVTEYLSCFSDPQILGMKITGCFTTCNTFDQPLKGVKFQNKPKRP